MKIAVGMSGGVDSSVAAMLLKEQGHDVMGVIMSVWDGSADVARAARHSCYGPDEKEDIEAARMICAAIGIELHVIDCVSEYRESVINYFKQEYLSGRTPNPCVVCNQLVKFGALIGRALGSGLDFDKFATGHYARVEFDPARSRHVLKKGADKKKDQSYFLYRLSQEQLSRLILPLGVLTKGEVRRLAAEKGLGVSEKDDSQDFYGGDYRELLDAEDEPGEIVDGKGKVLGRHGGIWNYTIGQRRGLGIAHEKPLYVVSLDREKNEVIVGTRDDLKSAGLTASGINWISVDPPSGEFRASVKVRSASREADAAIAPSGDNGAVVEFDVSQDGVAPGQSAVFYDGDTVIGGGVIDRTF
ncbi:MAG: tRNA 2-thiouridine(34) synthase MnmA [Spirochaetes bacterium]|nr:tRNA 2-thiouridine(34) synthase MnmA [Spirochaetota bacterium]